MSADKLHVKAAKFLPLVGLARSKQDPINHRHDAQYAFFVMLYISNTQQQETTERL